MAFSAVLARNFVLVAAPQFASVALKVSRSSVAVTPFLAGSPLRGAAQKLPSHAGVRRPSRVVSMTAGGDIDVAKVAKDTLDGVTSWWEKQDDKAAIVALGVSGIVGFWAALGLVGAIEKLPLLPDFFEFVGIVFSGWFVYRFLLFKPDREELLTKVEEAKAKITGK